MTEATPFLQKYDITFLRPPPIPSVNFLPDRGRGMRIRPDIGSVRVSARRSTTKNRGMRIRIPRAGRLGAGLF